MPRTPALFLLVFSALWNPTSLAETNRAKPPEAVSGDDFARPEFWESLNGRPVDESWDFVEGELRLVQPGAGANLISPPLPPHFELSWEWKIAEGSNTGLKYRVRKFGPRLFGNRYLGIEYQIIDEPPGSGHQGSTASIYDLVGPRQDKPLRPAGQWNRARVVAVGDRLEHYLNGQQVAAARTRGPSWEKALALSKFYGGEAFGRPRTGDRILLTDHGGKAVYRNFQFVAQTPTEQDHATPPASGPFLGNGLRNSWVDQTSVVVWTRTTATPEMHVQGTRFVSLSRDQARKLARQSDPEALLQAQLPEGASLDEMFGACPGTPGQVRLIYFPAKQRKQQQTTRWQATSAESDFTAQWKLDGLKPNTRYAVVAEARAVDGETPTAVLRGGFRTAPRAAAKEPIEFCFTTCHDFIRRDDGLRGHKIYPSMTELDPDFVVHAGDIEYYDKPDPWALTIELMRFKWGRLFSLPSNRAFYSNTTSYFIKDDHDTLKNDCWAGQRYGAVTFEQGVRLFNDEQFPSRNPRYATVRWGRDLQIWLLEGRDYRSPNDATDGPAKTILGQRQKAWLFRTLEASAATFKLICSPTPIVGPDRRNKRDNHANAVFEYEGNQIREKLAELEGVIVLCGDRHWQYASHDSEIDLWEFGCGPGSEAHQLGWKPGDRRPVHEFLRVKGGFLSGQLRYVGKDRGPRLTLRHRRVDGAPVSEFVFPRPSPEAGSEGGDADQPESGADAPVQTVSEDAARERP